MLRTPEKNMNNGNEKAIIMVKSLRRMAMKFPLQ